MLKVFSRVLPILKTGIAVNKLSFTNSVLEPFKVNRRFLATTCIKIVRTAKYSPWNHHSKRLMANHKHKKIIKLAKGFRGRANRVFSVAKHRVMKAKQYAYRDRKVKKRDMRSLWIMRINAATRMYGFPYSTFVYHLNRSNISLNRKVLADPKLPSPSQRVPLNDAQRDEALLCAKELQRNAEGIRVPRV